MSIYVDLIDGMSNATDVDLSGFKTDMLLQGGVSDLPQYTTPLLVSASGTPDTNSNVAAGIAYVPDSTSSPTIYYRVLIDTAETQAHDATVSNPRIDAVVLALDTTLSPTASADNIATIEIVKGTEAGSPTAPTDGDITTALGHSKWIRLANVAIANPFVSITGVDITDTRDFAYMDGSKLAVPNNEKMYFINAAGDLSAYLQLDSSDDLLAYNDDGNMFFRAKAAEEFKFSFVTTGDIFKIDDANNRAELYQGWELRVYDSSNTDYIRFYSDGTDDWMRTNNNRLRITAGGSNVLVENLAHSGTFFPSANNTYDYGSAGNHVTDIFTQNAVTVVSDPAEKEDIIDIDWDALTFVESMRLVRFKWKTAYKDVEVQVVDENGDPVVDEEGNPVMVTEKEEKASGEKRYHLGVLADQIKEVMTAQGISSDEFGAYVEDVSGKQLIRPTELNIMLFKAVQELYALVK